jgi:hypothetical protein
MVPHVVRPAQIIWNKVLGALFLLLALVILGSGVRYYTGPKNPAGVVMSGIFGITLAGFGINSFLKARRLSRL